MGNPTVLLETSSGDMLIELFAEQAPETVFNFLRFWQSLTGHKKAWKSCED